MLLTDIFEVYLQLHDLLSHAFHCASYISRSFIAQCSSTEAMHLNMTYGYQLPVSVIELNIMNL